MIISVSVSACQAASLPVSTAGVAVTQSLTLSLSRLSLSAAQRLPACHCHESLDNHQSL